jgi:hypothetical protein
VAVIEGEQIAMEEIGEVSNVAAKDSVLRRRLQETVPA